MLVTGMWLGIWTIPALLVAGVLLIYAPARTRALLYNHRKSRWSTDYWGDLYCSKHGRWKCNFQYDSLTDRDWCSKCLRTAKWDIRFWPITLIFLGVAGTIKAVMRAIRKGREIFSSLTVPAYSAIARQGLSDEQ